MSQTTHAGELLGLTSIAHYVIAIGIIATVTGVIMVGLVVLLKGPIKRQVWWPQASQLQKGLQMNFGYKEENCTEETNLINYIFVLIICFHHTLCGALIMPCVILGWEGAGRAGQMSFVSGCLLDVGFDIFDEVRMFLLFTCPSYFPLMGTQIPLAFYFIMGVCHHPLAIALMVPMLYNYPALPAFHYIAASLLLAAGIAYGTGSYKFTLDTSTKCGFTQYKSIVVIQFLTIWITRALVWFPSMWSACAFFYSEGATEFLVGGIILGILMSLFNLAMLGDCTMAAIKWLPRPMPTEEGDKAELKQALSQTGFSFLDILTPEAAKFRSTITVALAVRKMSRRRDTRDAAHGLANEELQVGAAA